MHVYIHTYIDASPRLVSFGQRLVSRTTTLSWLETKKSQDGTQAVKFREPFQAVVAASWSKVL